MQKNVASQKWTVFAFDETDNTAKTGDAANITATISIDGATAGTVIDTNPVEHSVGYYVFDISQAESNGDMLTIIPVSTTTSISVIGVPGSVVTVPPNFNLLDIDGSGEVDVSVSSLTVYGTAQGSAITALENISAGTVLVQTTSSITIYGTSKTTDITSLENLSAGTILVQATSALTIYAAAKTTDVTGLENISAGTVLAQCTSSITIYGTAQGSAITALENISGGTVLTQASAALTTYAGPTKAEMDTAHGLLGTGSAITALNNISAAQVNAEVLDVMNVDTYAEPAQGAPPAAPTIRQMIHYQYKKFRNKNTSTASAENIYNDAGNVIDQTSVLSDDTTTFTKGEVGSG